MKMLYVANARRSAELAAIAAPPGIQQPGEDRVSYIMRLAHDGTILDVNTAGQTELDAAVAVQPAGPGQRWRSARDDQHGSAVARGAA